MSFGSKIKVIDKKAKFLKFSKGWIYNGDVKPVSFKEKNFFLKKLKFLKILNINGGGKSFKGIDCSALIQIFLNFNNKFCPRDAKDQIRYFKKMLFSKILKKMILFLERSCCFGCFKKNLIHAYGPMKKTVIMDINQTIRRIETNCKIKGDRNKKVINGKGSFSLPLLPLK